MRFVNDDINLQVASLNNQLKILQSQEIKHQAIETSLEQIHEETITQMQQQLQQAREQRDQLVTELESLRE